MNPEIAKQNQRLVDWSRKSRMFANVTPLAFLAMLLSTAALLADTIVAPNGTRTEISVAEGEVLVLTSYDRTPASTNHTSRGFFYTVSFHEDPLVIQNGSTNQFLLDPFQSGELYLAGPFTLRFEGENQHTLSFERKENDKIHTTFLHPKDRRVVSVADHKRITFLNEAWDEGDYSITVTDSSTSFDLKLNQMSKQCCGVHGPVVVILSRNDPEAGHVIPCSYTISEAWRRRHKR